MSCCKSMVQGSTGVEIFMTVRDCDGNVVPLTDAVDPVVLKLKLGSSATVTRNAVVHDRERGIVRYQTIGGDFGTPGQWKAQLLITFPGGKVINSKPFVIQVDASI